MFDTSSPIVNATIQACVMNATSNIIAQILTAYKTNTPYSIDWVPVFQFVIFNALNCPPNFLWQTYIESKFPTNYLVPSKPAIAAAAAGNEKELDREQRTSEIFETKFSLRNVLTKFFLDQTIGAAANTLFFLIGFGGISGKTWEQSMQTVRDDFWTLIFAGLKLWPLVSFFNFAIIKSVAMRGLVGNLAGMAWGIYLSLKQT